MNTPAYAWMDGQLLPWRECTLHIRNQGVMIGASVFEGVRAYWSERARELYIFRLDDHLDRLRKSAKAVRVPLVFGAAALTDASIQVIKANGFKDNIHMIITAFLGDSPDFLMMTQPDDSIVAVSAITRPRKPSIEAGITCEVSSWRRISEADMPPRVKAGANYYHGRLANLDARAKGFDSCILLDGEGNVTESPGACVMLVLGGELHTAPTSDRILDSITRRTVIELAKARGLQVHQRHVGRSELYMCDELFFCGSGAEITPVIAVDKIPVGEGAPGEITRLLQRDYFAAVVGDLPGYDRWLTPVYQRG